MTMAANNKNGNEEYHKAFTGCLVGTDGTSRWFINGAYGRAAGLPSVVSADGSQHWYVENPKRGQGFGQRDAIEHRIGGPAIIRANGDQYWYFMGALHRDDGPAVDLADGTKKWWLNGIWVRSVLPNGLEICSGDAKVKAKSIDQLKERTERQVTPTDMKHELEAKVVRVGTVTTDIFSETDDEKVFRCYSLDEDSSHEWGELWFDEEIMTLLVGLSAKSAFESLKWIDGILHSYTAVSDSYIPCQVSSHLFDGVPTRLWRIGEGWPWPKIEFATDCT